MELGKQYGNIFSLYMGPSLTIVLNDYKAIKAAFIDQADIFAGRADGYVFRRLNTGKDGSIHGIALLEGEPWKQTRRFTLQTLRDLGMGKSTIQERILEEAQYLTEIFQRNIGTPFDPSLALHSSVSNVVCVLCFGKRFNHEDKKFKRAVADLKIAAQYLAQAGPLQSYPILRFIPGPIARKWKNFQEVTKAVWNFVESEIDEHTDFMDVESRDYIDAFLKQQAKGRSSDTGDAKSPFAYEDLLFNLRAFFGAGTETAAVTLLWIFLFMIHHPDVQDKVQKEIDEKIGNERSITVDDRSTVPYIEAVVHECQRLGNVAPFGVLRANVQETTLLGYRIPARSFIMPNFKASNMDPNLWNDPASFRPERFLDSHGKLVEPQYFMPFSIGKRACVGESLARMEIFLFFANIMQRFRLAAPPGVHMPSTDQYVTGISCRPLPFPIDIQLRHPK